MGITPASFSFVLVFFVAVGSNEDTPSVSARGVSSLDYINNLTLQSTIFLKEVTSEPLTDDTSYSKSQGHDSNQINVPTYEHKFHQTPDTGLVLKLHANRSDDSVRVFRREAAVEINDNENINTPWRQLIKNDTSAFILWNMTKRHAGFEPRDGTVDKCLDEFSDRKIALAPYMVSTTVRENGYFLRGFIHLISKYAYLHDILTVQKHYDELEEILQDHKSYSVALKTVIGNMDPEVKYALTCAQRRFCSCFWPLDVVRFEEQLSALSQYKFLLGTYLTFGYYIDPTIRVILIVAGLILNGALLITFVKHNDVITESIVVVMNMAVNSILILIIYVPLQYIHFYYSTIMPHEEFTNNGLFIAVQSALISVSGLSLLTLRVRRHFDVSRAVSWRGLSTPWQSVMCVSTVWILASSIALITYMFNDNQRFGYLLPPSLYIVLYILILPIATSRLKLYTEKSLVPPEQEAIISSSAILALSKTFWTTHVPLFMWLLLEGLCGFALKLISINYAYVEIMFCYFYFSYTCLNVLALNRANCGFRKLLFSYLFRFWHRPTEHQVVTMAVTQRAEPETQSPFFSYCTTV